MLIGISVPISFDGFYNFFLGMIVGILFLNVFFLVYFWWGKRDSRKKRATSQVDFKEEEIKDIISSNIEKAMKSMQDSSSKITPLIEDTCIHLVKEISAYYFPYSSYPLYELSAQELVELSFYIRERIETMLDKWMIRNLKNIKLSTLISMYEVKKTVGKKVEESKVVQFVKKNELDTVMKNAMKMYKRNKYVRGAITKKMIFVDLLKKAGPFLTHKALEKVVAGVIGIVGEETSNVYSKKIFNKSIQIDIEASMQDLIEEAKNEGTFDLE